MASLSLPSLRSDMLLRPMPPALFIAVAAMTLVAGAAYCMGYEGLRGGAAAWPSSLLWSAYGVWPWLFLFEYVKRREWDGDAPLSIPTIALLLVASGAVSVALEFLVDWLRGAHTAPVALQLLRRLPAIAATLLLMLLARREQRFVAQKAPSRPAEADVETLRRHAPDIRWIQAADNYLELHLDGQIWTRRLTMRQASEILEPLGFVRIHRSFIVNRDHASAFVGHGGAAGVKVSGGATLPIGKAFSSNIRRLH